MAGKRAIPPDSTIADILFSPWRSPKSNPEYAGAPSGTFGAFRGDNHKRLVDEDLLRDEHWSHKMLGLEEVATLLGNVRKAKKIHANRT